MIFAFAAKSVKRGRMNGTPDSLDNALLRLDPALAAAPRYPLAGGRTNRLWRVGTFTVKQFDLSAASPLFPNDASAEAKALGLFAPLGIAPSLRAAGSDWLIYDHVEGDIWSGDPAPVARALHRLHGARIALDSFRLAPNGSTAVLADARRIHALPGEPVDPGVGPITVAPIHGDLVAGNVLRTALGPMLIDWQCPAMGDPAEDICTFLSPAMSWLYSGAPIASDRAEAFLVAYPDADVVARARILLPVYRWRIAAHCAWKAAQGDPAYAEALKLELGP